MPKMVLRLLLLKPSQGWLVLNAIMPKMVLRLLLLDPPQGWLVLNAIMPKMVIDCYYWNHLKGG